MVNNDNLWRVGALALLEILGLLIVVQSRPAFSAVTSNLHFLLLRAVSYDLRSISRRGAEKRVSHTVTR